MNWQWIVDLIRSGKRLAVKHAPGILMGMGTVGVGTAVILSAKAGPRAVYLIEREEEKKAQNLPVREDGHVCLRAPLDWKETVRAVWKIYIPPVGLTVFGLSCFWAAHGIDLKRQAVVAGLYSTAEATLKEYQKKVVEMIGKDNEKEIRNAVAQDRIDQAAPQTASLILPPDTDTWCIIDGQIFPSSYNRIKDAQNKANHKMFREMYISKTELYWLLDPSGEYLRPDGEDGMVGWTVDKLLVLDIHGGLTPEHKPMLSIDYTDDYGNRYDPVPGYANGY